MNIDEQPIKNMFPNTKSKHTSKLFEEKQEKLKLRLKSEIVKINENLNLNCPEDSINKVLTLMLNQIETNESSTCTSDDGVIKTESVLKAPLVNL